MSRLTREERQIIFNTLSTSEIMIGFNNSRVESKKRQKNSGNMYAMRRFASMSVNSGKGE